jgi:hypothetical protein
MVSISDHRLGDRLIYYAPGDLIQLNVLGQSTIIINSPQLATDILSKKSAIYSSRPHLTMACDLVGWKPILVLLKYTDKFKSCRRMFQSVIGTRASVDKFRDTLEEEASLMLRRLVDDPKDFVGPVRKCVLSSREAPKTPLIPICRCAY